MVVLWTSVNQGRDEIFKMMPSDEVLIDPPSPRM